MGTPKNIRYNPANKRIVFTDQISTEPFREVSPKKNNKKSGRKPLTPVVNPPETLGTPIGLLLILTR
jgi:hypothetical protein